MSFSRIVDERPSRSASIFSMVYIDQNNRVFWLFDSPVSARMGTLLWSPIVWLSCDAEQMKFHAADSFAL
jgi:hypothetical protein